MKRVYIIELVKYKLRFFENGKNLSGIPKNKKTIPITKIKLSINIGK
jgi:hypothetical protein